MDIFAALLSPGAKEVSATVIVVLIIGAILSGLLIPLRTHRREMKAAWEVAEQHRKASEGKDKAIAKLLEQNSVLLAGVRIADKFYRDFVPAIDENTITGVPNVGS